MIVIGLNLCAGVDPASPLLVVNYKGDFAKSVTTRGLAEMPSLPLEIDAKKQSGDPGDGRDRVRDR